MQLVLFSVYAAIYAAETVNAACDSICTVNAASVTVNAACSICRLSKRFLTVNAVGKCSLVVNVAETVYAADSICSRDRICS